MGLVPMATSPLSSPLIGGRKLVAMIADIKAKLKNHSAQLFFVIELVKVFHRGVMTMSPTMYCRPVHLILVLARAVQTVTFSVSADYSVIAYAILIPFVI